MSYKKPIGVFDSGLGGLSVVERILEQIPQAKIIYFGDTARVPYGEKTAAELIDFADEITKFLVNNGCGVIIDACNSTSAVALEYLKEKYINPIIGVIKPGILSAIEVTKNGRIGVIATEATVKSEAHKKTAKEIDADIVIYPLACPEFVPLVEAGEVTGKKAHMVVEKTLQPLMEKNIDTIILGCTHYPFLAPTIRKVMGENVILVDPAYETAKEAKTQYLKEENYDTAINEHKYYVTGDPDHFQRVGERLIGKKLPTVQKVIL